MMKIISGNILSDIPKDKVTVICHQVNCQGIMGAGLAKQIRSDYPDVYNRYRHFCYNRMPSGILGHCLLLKGQNNLWIANLFGQLNYGTGKRQTDYEALKRSLNILRLNIVQNEELVDATVRIPYNMGCGLAGGDWNVVQKIIKDVFDNSPVNVEIWKL